MAPEKTILFVDEPRLSKVQDCRQIPVGLGQDFMAATVVALRPFDDR